MKAPELLLPAGSLEKMRAAYDYGADAVYAGQPRYSLRARNNEFRLEQLQQGIAEARRLGKKLFVTSNLLPHNDKVRTYMRDIEPVIAMRPDALIMADPGLIMMVREKWPEMPIHLSVQANTVNYATVKFWQKAGYRVTFPKDEKAVHPLGIISLQYKLLPVLCNTLGAVLPYGHIARNRAFHIKRHIGCHLTCKTCQKFHFVPLGRNGTDDANGTVPIKVPVAGRAVTDSCPHKVCFSHKLG